MTSLHRELLKILKEEKSLLESLYRIVSEERDAIVGGSSVELERILRDKEQTLMRLGLWEEERQKLLKRYGFEGKSLSVILQEALQQFERGDEIDELYQSMKTLLPAIAEIQKINEQLIDRSIIHIETALRFLESFGIKAKQTLSKEA